ncbi:PREDICTED: peroxisome proliferator-activated receptor gamma coactivator 1-beta [Gavialis gangeticus]|uniref:peroxisome proliferator-activated receptor gamma coactivator 1-beta n=1 Tax=Gavialis gangeticus TaxID=94835 RepID=UPI00092F3FD9|nr:PREDICTED: peroxisome proliferator-activated receptor gamma coactivator 1-beta [Gavialis gangeticus]
MEFKLEDMEGQRRASCSLGFPWGSRQRRRQPGSPPLFSLQYEVSGEEHLYSDFPEIDLSQLDAGDFDSASCFSELQWCAEHSETESSQYSTDDSELLQIIDSENEALLAALTETLDDIQEDDMGLAAFRTMEEGDAPTHTSTSPTPSPKPTALVVGGPPPAPEVDELSLLKKLLLSPTHVPPSCEAQRDGSARRHGTPKSRPQRSCTKVEGLRDRKSRFLQAQSRSCTELHRHLTSTTHCPQTKATWPPDTRQGSSGSIVPQNPCAHNEDDSDTSEDSLSSSDATVMMLSPEDGISSQFCEKEMHSVVELIRYMHTYCLPPRKLPIRDPADVKHQHCNSPYKRAKPDCPLQTTSHCSQESWATCTWEIGSYQKPRTSSFSILKELLSRDITCDVSKPYRLGKPVYASWTRPSGSRSPGPPAQEADTFAGTCKSKVKMPVEKTELRQSPKAEPEAKKETGSPEDEAGKHVVPTAQPPPGKAGRKQESAIYAVRRSKRLNPELGHWLSFLDEPSPEPSGPRDATESWVQDAFALREPTLCPALENFDTEAPAAEVEVGSMEEGDNTTQTHRMEPPRSLLGSPDERDRGEMDENRSCSLLDQTETPRCLALSLTQTDTTFGKRNFEQVLTVELCGTAGLTPPTTPPYKPAEEDLYKPDIHHGPEKEKVAILPPLPGPRTAAADTATSRRLLKKHPEQTELYAHLSRAAVRPPPLEQQGVLKRPFSRSFGDHDYCQVMKPEAVLQRKVLKSWEPLSHTASEHKRRVPDTHYQGLVQGSKEENGQALWKEGTKQLRDQEIRASLTKHFGFLDSALEDEYLTCKTLDYDTVFEDSCSESGSPVEEEEEEEEEEEHWESPLESKLCLRRNPLARTSIHHCSRSRSSSGSSCCRSRSPANRRAFRCENGEQCQGGTASRSQMEKRREKAINEGRMVYIRNLSSSMSSSELQKRFEVFGEIIECQVLTRKNRGDKYGFITYRCSEDAALSLKNGASLRKRNEPSFQLSYGGLRHFFWTRYTDLDSNAEESSLAPVKSKYETMDFDSLLQEAQQSLHR